MEMLVLGLGLLGIIFGVILAIFPEKATSKNKRHDTNQVMTTRIIGVVLIVINIKFLFENL